MTDEPLRVLIVDDHWLVRDGMRTLLSTRGGIEVVGEAADGEAAVAAAAELAPDVVVMDLHMPGISGIEATRRLTASSPHVRVLVLTMSEDDDSVFSALRAGARGYLLKGSDQEQLVRAIRAVADGEGIFSPAIALRITDYFSRVGRQAPQLFPELTDREREVLELIARGLKNHEISGKLYLSEKTVRNHVSNILTKLQVQDRAAAIVRARDAGLGLPG
jgi:DNA-binding NarL/FixJ family response regulator